MSKFVADIIICNTYLLRDRKVDHTHIGVNVCCDFWIRLFS